MQEEKGLKITLQEDMEIVIYSCNKISHRFLVVLMKLDEELLNVKSMTIEYGLKEIERFLGGGQKKELAEL